MSDFATQLARFYGAGVQGELRKLRGEASTRRYYRFVASGVRDAALPPSVIVMQLPDDPEAKAAGRAQAEAFLDVQLLLSARALAVPRVHLSDLEQGVMLLEDLGDETFESRVHARGPRARNDLYGDAIDLLARMHTRCAPPGDPGESIAFRRRFEPSLLRWELDHFREHGLEVVMGPLDAASRAELDAAFDALVAQIVALPLGFVHRDYQSRNLMWAARDRLTVIDFQDAMLGPAPYDLVALLCDSYVELDAALQGAMLQRYAARRGYAAEDRAQLERGFHLISVQRKLKDAGRFVFLDRVRGNPDFLPYFTGSLRYADRALASLEELSPLRALLSRLLPGFPELPAPRAQTPTSEHISR